MKTNMKKVWLIGLIVLSVCAFIIGIVLFFNRKPLGSDTQQTESEQEILTNTQKITEESQAESEIESEQSEIEESQGTEEPTETTESTEITESTEPTPPTAQGDKVIYLTFDDGPGAHTEKLLNVLDEYGVKATFFVTNCQPQYQNMIGEAYRRGHTIALHTANHMYSNYASKEVYYADLAAIHAIVLEQTGEEATLIRFPGGSSNSISKKYCEGIMTFLTQDVANHGYRYCDWNVSSGDGNSSITTDAVITNVIGGISGKSIAVVLQHDTVESSVEAVDDIIRWGLENGYTFLPMTDDTQMVHHSVSN